MCKTLFRSCSNKRFPDWFKSQYQMLRRNKSRDLIISMYFFCVLFPPTAYLFVNTYLALATHSMMASFLPTVTVVFFGGMMMEGAMGSAGPPTSIAFIETHTHTQVKPIYKSTPTSDVACASAWCSQLSMTGSLHVDWQSVTITSRQPVFYKPTINTAVCTLGSSFCAPHSISLFKVLDQVLEAIM